MNAWQMPESRKYLREDLVLGNGHLLDQVLKRSGVLSAENSPQGVKGMCCHGHLPRDDDGAFEFWRIKGISSEPCCAISTLI